MTNSQPTHNQLVSEPYGAGNVIAVSFQEDANAYNALTVLKELDSQHRISIQEGLVVERTQDGQVVEKDRVDSDFLVGTASGGLIGLLVGIIGGPLGMLIGGTTGLFVGSLFDITDGDDAESALSAVSGAVQIGHTAVLAVVSEPSHEVVDTAMSGLGGTVLRRPVAEVEAEISAAESAQRKAKREARKELVRGRHEHDKAAASAKVEELKAKLPHSEKTPA